MSDRAESFRWRPRCRGRALVSENTCSIVCRHAACGHPPRRSGRVLRVGGAAAKPRAAGKAGGGRRQRRAGRLVRGEGPRRAGRDAGLEGPAPVSGADRGPLPLLGVRPAQQAGHGRSWARTPGHPADLHRRGLSTSAGRSACSGVPRRSPVRSGGASATRWGCRSRSASRIKHLARWRPRWPSPTGWSSFRLVRARVPRSAPGRARLGRGPVTRGGLHARGITTIGQLARSDPGVLERLQGARGRHLSAMANDEDGRSVERAGRALGGRSRWAAELTPDLVTEVLGHPSTASPRPAEGGPAAP